uniref:Protein FAR1-RELATED SEQUENCE n=1 Tax=Nicotiana tabacum TaxID=4097 RepID=A0A1S4BGV6_TOBAC|nr:PREDICTED: protein FAR-RED IMPAIRED RESPONSE 1-like [Nicotiana tabacum]
MGNVHPDAIITDPCQSINVATAEVMPNTIHRYCIWHIFSKLPLYLSGVRPSKIARGEFKSMVLDSITVKDFERKWTEYIARMFVHQYELAIIAKHEKELEADYRSKGFQIVCESMFKWEKQAIQCYTRTVYEFFKTRLRKLYDCEVSNPDDHQVVPVLRNSSCKWFESRGILCFHILKILSHKKIDKIDERYMLTKWRSNVIRPHLNRFHQVGYPNMTPEYKTYRSMLKYFDMACDIALGTSVKVQYVKHSLKKMVHNLQN